MLTRFRQIAASLLIAMLIALLPAFAFADAPGTATPAPEKTAPPSMAQPATPTPAPTTTTTPPPSGSPLDDMPSYGEALVRMVVILFSILIALMLLARFLPRWLGRSLTVGAGGTIKVIDSLALEPRKRVYLLKVGEQFILVGTSESGVHVLADKSLDGQQLAETLKASAPSRGDAAVAPSVTSSTLRSFAAALSGKPAAKEGA